jgi:hypothetical protein
MGRHSADGRYRYCTVLVLDWLTHALIVSNSFRMERSISSTGIHLPNEQGPIVKETWKGVRCFQSRL